MKGRFDMGEADFKEVPLFYKSSFTQKLLCSKGGVSEIGDAKEQNTKLPICGGCGKELSLVCLNKDCDWSSVT